MVEESSDERVCSECRKSQSKQHFSKKQWGRGAKRRCNACLDGTSAARGDDAPQPAPAAAAQIESPHDPQVLERLERDGMTEAESRCVQDTLAELGQLGLIARTKSRFGSPVYSLADPAIGGRLRLRIEYSAVAALLQPDPALEALQVPTEDEVYARIPPDSVLSVFTHLTLPGHGFWPVPLDDEASQVAAFVAGEDIHVEPKVMPRDFPHADKQLQRFMEGQLEELVTPLPRGASSVQAQSGCVVCLDKVVLFSATKEQHSKALERFLKLCQSKSIVWDKKKMKMFAKHPRAAAMLD